MDLVARVPADLADLIPVFLENRSRERERLRRALEEGDFAKAQHLGETMYALGNPYGFRQITTFGRQIREACAAKDAAKIEQVLEEYGDYLGKVTMTVVAEPVERVKWKKQTSAVAIDENTKSVRTSNG
jgi:hypothetical protein